MVSLPNFTNEMEQAPVGSLLAAFLTALVQGQYEASVKTIELFDQLMFDDKGAVKTTDFKFLELTTDTTDPDNPLPKTTERQITVPTILLTHHNGISIDHADFQFKVRIASIEHQEGEKKTAGSGRLRFGALLGSWGTLGLSGGIAHQRKTMQGIEVTRDYSLEIKVHVVREQPPAAISKILDMMLGGILAPN